MFKTEKDTEGNWKTIEINNWNVEDVLKDMEETKAIYRFKPHVSRGDLQNAQFRMYEGKLQQRADEKDAPWYSNVVRLPSDPKVGALYRIGSWGDFDYAQGWNEGMSTEDTKNLAYWERNMLALLYANVINRIDAARWAESGLNIPESGFVNGWFDHQGEGFEGWSRIISLENGTITFHVPDDFDLGDLPKIEPNWDGHTTAEKWKTVQSYCGLTSNPSSN